MSSKPEPFAAPAAGPRGIGGWLLLPMVLLVVTPIRLTVETALDFSRLAQPGVWAQLTTPGGVAHQPSWVAVIVVVLALNTALVGSGIWLLFLFLTKSRRVRAVAIAWLAGNAAVQIIDLTMMQAFPALMAELQKPFDVRIGVTYAAWIPYFQRSRRVRNTFVR